MINLTAPFASLVLEIDELLNGPLSNTASNVAQRGRREGVWRGDDMMIMTGEAPLPQPPGPWVNEAACRGRNDIMVLPCGSARMSQRRIRDLAEPAKEICGTCVVIEPCRDWALTTPDPAVDHIAGGLTPAERQQLRRNLIGLHPI